MNYQEIDKSPNCIDMQKARNVNELLGILSRIKTSVVACAAQVVKLKISRKIEIGKAFDFQDILDILGRVEQHHCELQVARGLGNSIAYEDKRKRYFTVLESVTTSCLEVRGRLFEYMNNVGMRLESDMLVAFSSITEKFMHGFDFSSKSVVYVPGPNTLQKNFVYTEAVLENGFTMPEWIVRLTMYWTNGVYSYSVSFPDSTLATDPEVHWFRDQRELKSFLLESTNLFKLRQRIKLPKNVVRIDGVSSVDSSASTLNVNLEAGLQPKDIQGVLSNLLPIVQRAVGASRFDVLHRVTTTDEGNKVIQFVLAGRRIVDGKQAIALRQALSMSKSSYESLCKALNHVGKSERTIRR